MKTIKNHFENTLNELVNELKFYDVRNDAYNSTVVERQIAEVQNEIDVLEGILEDGEGNLLHFNKDGSFKLWCIHCSEGNNQVVEFYNAEITFENFEYLLEVSPCLDVSESFSLQEILPFICATDNLTGCVQKNNKYYIVSNDVLEKAVIDFEKIKDNKKPDLNEQILANSPKPAQVTKNRLYKEFERGAML